MTPQDDKTYTVLDIVSNHSSISQREIAKKSGMSLGMANCVLKRLIKIGYVKVMSLDKNRLQYILTPHGIAEKARRTTQYMIKTVKSYEEFVGRARALVRDQYNGGIRHFVIVGDGELSRLVALAIREESLERVTVEKLSKIENHVHGSSGTIILNCGHEDNDIGISVLAAMLGLENGNVQTEKVAVKESIK